MPRLCQVVAMALNDSSICMPRSGGVAHSPKERRTTMHFTNDALHLKTRAP